MNILLIENHDDVRLLMTLELSATNETVALSPTTWRAVCNPRYWNHADLLILDWSLGEHTGNDVLDIRDALYPELPCIIYTGRPSEAVSRFVSDRKNVIIVSKHNTSIKTLSERLSDILERMNDESGIRYTASIY